MMKLTAYLAIYGPAVNEKGDLINYEFATWKYLPYPISQTNNDSKDYTKFKTPLVTIVELISYSNTYILHNSMYMHVDYVYLANKHAKIILWTIMQTQ